MPHFNEEKLKEILVNEHKHSYEKEVESLKKLDESLQKALQQWIERSLKKLK
ncbi:hypothetical protein [Hazenella coriacea]|uniref:Uncharacterized protein n=1 Tax=Hazenella coriacea TaxID=1179467 RepID=A0A4R3LBF2_9BACL|nr:hypothetical protein [Hazenella coriacea]TCS96628.1 hypothetical protein EDD58_101264 [Hazenella coriacea]